MNDTGRRNAEQNIFAGVEFKRLLEEELDPAKGNCGRGSAYFLTFLMCRKYCLSSSSVTRSGRLLKVLGELAHYSDIGLVSAFRHASELKRFDHSLSKFGHGYTSYDLKSVLEV